MSSILYQPLRLLLLGFGNVAQSFLPLLAARSIWLEHELGVHPIIMGIGTRKQGFYVHPDGIDITMLDQQEHPLHWFNNRANRVQDAETFIQSGKAAGASLLLELTSLQPKDGQPALTHIRTALQLEMDVITANKGPVAYAQAELQALARHHHAQFRFESTVMDGLPLINLAQFTLPAVGIRSFRALLNSTSSLVLSMIEQGNTLEEAISKSQNMGIAEANPWYDLDGWDAVMKTTILANTLLKGLITPQMVLREGIRNLTIEEIRNAASEGNPIRLVSTSHLKNEAIIAEVRPQRITGDDILYVGKGTTGVISLETEAMGTITLIEHEPEVLQTAYGILSDLITIIRQRNR